ncbi:hypothetical protein HDU87_004530 [Geranomyces variabilis]|uniref:Uncharacterized protein n=1 Tax=Geranomyces variabilis TaxID=109894 RepID=A0AAD5TJW0_9FUNG|nr:hypothetical protein HDU87_004530 [Geranomyces variabilis]
MATLPASARTARFARTICLLRPPVRVQCARRAFAAPVTVRIDTSDPRYNQSNAEWSVLALDHPLVHEQTGIKVYLVGIHHNSPASLERVQQVIEEAKPVAVCLEVDSRRLRRFSAKAEVVLGGLRKAAHPTDSSTKFASGRLAGVRAVNKTSHDDFSAATVNSAAFGTLTERDRSILARLDMDPVLHLSPTHIHYGLEIGVAIRAAYEHGAVVRAIDVHPRVLQSDSTHSALIKDLVRRYRLLPPPTSASTRRRTPLVARMLFWLVTRMSFGIRRNVDMESEADVSSVRDHATYLRCWKAFYPGAYFWWLEVRNAGMVDQLRQCVLEVAKSKGLLDTRPSPQSPPSIVAVVGKSHVFGMAEMWSDVVAREKFPRIANSAANCPPLRGEEIISVDDLIVSTAAEDLADAAAASDASEETVVDSSSRENIANGHVHDDPTPPPASPRHTRGSSVAPPPPPSRPPPKPPTGIRYVD